VARQERAVDPTAGPLQSFAYELRKVRLDAGNPTYRALSKIAGYSPTTLSEAASGTRKPSLDVVLAYVGACQGDVEAWREKWYELDTALGGNTPREEPDLEPEIYQPPAQFDGRSEWLPDLDDPPGSGRAGGWLPDLDETPSGGRPGRGPAHAADGPEGPRKRRGLLAAGIAGGASLLLAAAAGVFIWAPWKQAAQPVAQGCPNVPARPAFIGTTYGNGAPVRASAVVNDPVLGTISPDCKVGFTGFCIGEKVADATIGTPDIRWFILEDGNVIASAVIHGNPPATLQPVRCNKDRPAPAAIALALSGNANELKATANGRNLDIVGFAARVPGAGNTWRQLGITEGTFSAVLRLEKATRGQVAIVATACLGGESPTGIIDAKVVAAENPTAAPQAANLSQQDSVAAAKAACQYPKKP
jgi:hypothetical protein